MKKYTPRKKRMIKMTRNGAVTLDMETGKISRVNPSKREADFTKARDAPAENIIMPDAAGQTPFEQVKDASRQALKREQQKQKKHAGKLNFEKGDLPPDAATSAGKAPAGKPDKQPAAQVAKIPGKTAENMIHGKVRENGDDNAAVEGAHSAEELAERGALRFSRNTKLRKERNAARMEKAAAEKHYKKTVQEAPEETAHNPLSSLHQKQRNKKQYAKGLRDKKKAAKKAAEATKKTAAFVKRHWKGFLILGVLVLAFIFILSVTQTIGAILSGTGNMITGTSYVSKDADMLGAEADYAALEQGILQEARDAERTHPGYDEYHYDLADTGHDPYVLTSILMAMQPGYTRAEAQDNIRMLFELQYTLTFTEETETRYRTRTVPDEETGEIITIREPYTWKILNVKLENNDLSRLPVTVLTEDQLSMYAVYMRTLGNRPDLFPQGAYPDASRLTEPQYYDIPPEALADARFAAMMEEAEKYLGYPYVWGGSSPATSFDCSGYVSWVINHSGWDVGRRGAQGLCNICTPVSSADAKPGDLVFFKGTYDTPGVSHVGIYVGDNTMLHCGNPISYTSINTSYWQSHFYTFGRLP